jgi:O-antigen/teichoic acid export membrane protein
LFAIALFTSGVVLTTIGTVLDTVLIGLLQGWLQLVRNVIFASVKLVLILFAAGWFGDSESTVYATWIAGELISLVVVAVLMVRLGHFVSMPSPEWQSIFGLGRNAMGHHVLNLARLAPALITPVLVAGLLSPRANAEFYVTLLLGGSLQIVASAATFTLYAVANQSPEKLHHQVRFTLGLSAAGVTVGIILLWLTGEFLLSLFGFSDSGVDQSLLLLLGLAAYPMILKDHWIALRRLRQDVRWAAWVTTAGAFIEIVFAAVGAIVGGILGLAAAWLVAQLIQAALMAALVYHAAALSTVSRRGRGDSEG